MTSTVQLCSCARFEEGGGAGFPRFFAPASDWGEGCLQKTLTIRCL